MDKSFDSVSIVVEHKHDRIQTKLQHIGERLHSQVQAAFTSDKDASLVVIILPNGFECSYCSTACISNRSEYCLIVHAGATGELRAAKSEC